MKRKPKIQSNTKALISQYQIGIMSISKITTWLLIYLSLGFGPLTTPVICVKDDGSIELELLCECHPESNLNQYAIINNLDKQLEFNYEPEDDCESCLCIPIYASLDSPIFRTNQKDVKYSSSVYHLGQPTIHQTVIGSSHYTALLRQQNLNQKIASPNLVVLRI